MIKPVVQFTYTRDIQTFFTANETPIWRTRLWIYEYIKTLPFMAEYDEEFNKIAIFVTTLIIDFVELKKVDSTDALRRDDRRWMLNPTDRSELLIHFEGHKPPLSFFVFRTGLALGFTYQYSELLGKIKTWPFLLDIPLIEDQTDLLRYQRMAFSSGKITIDNSSGMLDEYFLHLYGNNVDLLTLDEKNKLEEIRQFFLESYSLGLSTATFNVKDKRARLSFNAPVETYTKEKYPYIDDNLIDKVEIDAYGYCRGVPGTCINRNNIYVNEVSMTFNLYFDFKFARKITSVEEVWVKMSDKWTQVFPGLGIIDSDTYSQLNPHPIQLVYKNQNGSEQSLEITNENKNTLGDYDNNGIIRIWHTQAMKDNPGNLDRMNGDANEVKMNGVFVDLHTPGDIIKDLLTHYGDLPDDESWLNAQEWARETAGMKQIGICLNEKKSVFDWIELIQNGSMLGFQLVSYRDLFSARVDNSNRKESFNIKWNEILNKPAIEPEIGSENYASFSTINYLKDYADNETLTIVDKTFRNDILNAYRFEKEYQNDNFLSGYRNPAQSKNERTEQAKKDVEKKGKIVLENFTKIRPVIRNIELDGLRWDEIQLFSTGWIDFKMELPRQMKIIQKYMKPREFMQQLRVKVIKCRRNLRENKTFIDVIQCDRLRILEGAL